MRSEISEKRTPSLVPALQVHLSEDSWAAPDSDPSLTLRRYSWCTATSAACAVDACIIARFACCALRACVAAAAACVAALAARTASFNCAYCSFTNWRKNSTSEPPGTFVFSSWHHWRSHLSNVHAVVVCTSLFCHWLTALRSVTFLPAEDVHKPGTLTRSLVLLGNCPESSLAYTTLFFFLSWPCIPQQLFTSNPCLTTHLLNCKQT